MTMNEVDRLVKATAGKVHDVSRAVALLGADGDVARIMRINLALERAHRWALRRIHRERTTGKGKRDAGQ